jgi:hypothetical protein
MTNEEAIKELKIIREDYWDEYGDPMPALDMAIKALEQQPKFIVKSDGTIEQIKNCNDCKEYDQDKHCCPGFNKVIRNTVEEMKQPCENCISRKAILDCQYTIDESETLGISTRNVVDVDDILNAKPVQPKYNTSEWCTDCREYDQEKHCCPRFNRVIRNAVEEVKKPKTGHWIIKPHVYGVTYCSECDFELKIDNTNYCPNCGAKMVEPQESEETDDRD